MQVSGWLDFQDRLPEGGILLSAADEVVEGLHGFRGRVCVVTVDLEKVDIVRVQPLQGRVKSVKDCAPGQAWYKSVRILVTVGKHLTHCTG